MMHTLEASAPPVAAVPPVAGELKQRILIVDDDPNIVQVIEQALTFKGYSTCSTTDGEEAFRIFREEGEFDVVLTDLVLPGISGIELLEKFKELDPTCEVLVLTGFGSNEKAVEALKKGAYDYLKKPTNIDELFIAVSKAIEKKKLSLENIAYQMDLERVIEERSSELLRTQKFLHSVLESSTEYFIIASDAEGLITLFNSGAERLFGYKRTEVQGHRAILFLAQSEAGNAAGMQDFLKSGVIDQAHTVVTRDGREITISLTVTPIQDESARSVGYIWIGKDITEQLALQAQLKEYAQNLEKLVAERTREIQERNRRLEDTLTQLNDTQMQLLQSEKMASIGQLAAGVAHEINNPIGFINSNLSTLKKYIINLKDYCRAVDRVVQSDDADSIEELIRLKKIKKVDFILDDVTSVIEESIEGTDRVKTIVQDLKDFSHQDRGTLNEYDLNKGIRSTLNIVWNELKYKAEVIQDLGDLPLVRCYPQQLNQVLMNLLVNASHAIADKGKIYVRSRARDDEVVIEIEDTGCGIPAENLAKIFEPFFTTKEVGKGTGLGLSLSYRIVERHGGRIEVDSRVDVGTTFRVILPADGPPAAAAEWVPALAEEA
ncbi:MAG: response regulator [Candidatus Zixiibacteriota bacterium]|nr:MAG: response regulator [candidate division Zixibacteria bacterium]